MKTIERFKLDIWPQPEIIRIRKPVLLAHGLGAVGSMVKKSLLHDECMLYREHGICAYAPNVVPYTNIEIRAKAWAKIVDQILKETGADSIHVIAHSMGGLDFRHLITNLGYHDRIFSLTTLATPHRGTSLPDLFLTAPDIIKKASIDLINWFGNSIFPTEESNLMGALKELRPEYIINTFNPQTPDHPDVTYQSVTASCGKGTTHSIPKLLIPFNNFIHEKDGINDGYVPQESMRYGKEIFSTTLSHSSQIKLDLSPKLKPRWKELWLNIARAIPGD